MKDNNLETGIFTEAEQYGGWGPEFYVQTAWILI